MSRWFLIQGKQWQSQKLILGRLLWNILETYCSIIDTKRESRVYSRLIWFSSKKHRDRHGQRLRPEVGLPTHRVSSSPKASEWGSSNWRTSDFKKQQTRKFWHNKDKYTAVIKFPRNYISSFTVRKVVWLESLSDSTCDSMSSLRGFCTFINGFRNLLLLLPNFLFLTSYLDTDKVKSRKGMRNKRFLKFTWR